MISLPKFTSDIKRNILSVNIHLCGAIFYLSIFTSAVQYLTCQYSPLRRNILPANIHLCGALFYLSIFTSSVQYFTCQYSPKWCTILPVNISLCSAIFYLPIFTWWDIFYAGPRFCIYLSFVMDSMGFQAGTLGT